MERIPKLASRFPVAAIVAPLILAAGPASAEPAASAKIAAGKAFAELACSSCHQVSADQPPPAPVYDSDTKSGVPAPSFLAIAGAPGVGAARLHAVITHPHYPMREQLIGDDDLDAVIAYILSLGPAGAAKR